MSFVDSAEGLQSRLHLSHIPLPMLVGVIALALVACAGLAFSIATYASGQPAFAVKASSQEDLSEGFEGYPAVQAASQAAIKVHIAGAVKAPGVYELAVGSRVQDAVDAAGGFCEDAEPEAVNLARVLVDGEQVRILTKDEALAASQGASAAFQDGAASVAGPGLVNINTADAAALQTLSGVGPATAAAIIEERQANGPFASIEDIQRVSGIGAKKYAKLKDSICV